MEALKASRTAQSPPPCLYDPRVIRLNILKYQNSHPEDYESQMKTFRELLPNLSMSSWDPKVLELLNNYHKSLLYPHNYVHNGKFPKDSLRHRSFIAFFPPSRLQQFTIDQPEFQPKSVVE